MNQQQNEPANRTEHAHYRSGVAHLSQNKSNGRGTYKFYPAPIRDGHCHLCSVPRFRKQRIPFHACHRRDPRGDTMRERWIVWPERVTRSYTDIELKTTGKHGNKQAQNSPAEPNTPHKCY